MLQVHVVPFHKRETFFGVCYVELPKVVKRMGEERDRWGSLTTFLSKNNEKFVFIFYSCLDGGLLNKSDFLVVKVSVQNVPGLN